MNYPIDWLRTGIAAVLVIFLLTLLGIRILVRTLKKLQADLSALPQAIASQLQKTSIGIVEVPNQRLNESKTEPDKKASLERQPEEFSPKSEPPPVQSKPLDVQQAYADTVQGLFNIFDFMERYQDQVKRVGIELKREVGNIKFGDVRESASGTYILVANNSNTWLYPYFGVLKTSQENSAQACFDCDDGLFTAPHHLHELTITPAELENKAGQWRIKKKGALKLR